MAEARPFEVAQESGGFTDAGKEMQQWRFRQAIQGEARRSLGPRERLVRWDWSSGGDPARAAV